MKRLLALMSVLFVLASCHDKEKQEEQDPAGGHLDRTQYQSD